MEQHLHMSNSINPLYEALEMQMTECVHFYST